MTRGELPARELSTPDLAARDLAARDLAARHIEGLRAQHDKPPVISDACRLSPTCRGQQDKPLKERDRLSWRARFRGPRVAPHAEPLLPWRIYAENPVLTRVA